jgi:hypothetical protein
VRGVRASHSKTVVNAGVLSLLVLKVDGAVVAGDEVLGTARVDVGLELLDDKNCGGGENRSEGRRRGKGRGKEARRTVLSSAVVTELRVEGRAGDGDGLVDRRGVEGTELLHRRRQKGRRAAEEGCENVRARRGLGDGK